MLFVNMVGMRATLDMSSTARINIGVLQPLNAFVLRGQELALVDVGMEMGLVVEMGLGGLEH